MVKRISKYVCLFLVLGLSNLANAAPPKSLSEYEKEYYADKAYSFLHDCVEKEGDLNVVFEGDCTSKIADILNKYDGFSGYPQVVSRADFDQLSPDSDRIYRGLSKKYVEGFKTGAFFHGDSGNTSGIGIYATTDKEDAAKYARISTSLLKVNDENTVLSMMLAPDAKVVTCEDMSEIHAKYMKNHPSDTVFKSDTEFDKMVYSMNVLDLLCELCGFDAVYYNSENTGVPAKHYRIQNRSKVILCDE